METVKKIISFQELEEKEGLFEHPEKCWPCLCFTQDTEARSADL